MRSDSSRVTPTLRLLSVLAFGLAFAAGSAPSLRAADPDDSAPTLDALERAAGGKVDVTRSPRTGLATFLRIPGGVAAPALAPGGAATTAAAATPEARALAFLGAYGRLFGLRDASQLVATRTSPRDSVGMDHVRIQQVHGGVPVTGAELAVHLKGSRVVAVNGKALRLRDDFDVFPTVTAEGARAAARDLLQKRLKVDDAELSEPRLEVFDLGLIGGPQRPTRLAWFIEATKIDLREYIWVDAKRAGVLKHFSQLTDAKKRAIYDAHDQIGAALPGTLVRSEGQPATGDPDADSAYDFSGDVYDYYKTHYNRDSYDDKGSVIKSTVHYCPDANHCPLLNAYWNGSQMAYGDGFPLADDVAAHELTHAVTDRTAHLFYYMQSGALNESFSDIFGETVDLGNGKGDDSPAARWFIGEDLPVLLPPVSVYNNAIRSMSDPTVFPFNDPGKMSDPEFICEATGGGDHGGVHSNSGVPNHAYMLMVDGGTYNGQTITGIGLTKAGAIQYRTLTTYLLSASDFLDDYEAMIEACNDLIGGSAGITAGACTQVQKALDAVEMASTWPCLPTQPSVPALCPVGTGPVDVFNDDLENSHSGNWTTTVLRTGNVWGGGKGAPPIYWDAFATSGDFHFWGWDAGVISDSTVNMAKSVMLPAGARMQFDHSYGFESAWDGGVVEYSLNNGASWINAGGLITAGAPYGGTISTCCGNPLAGRSAFVRESWGYTASQLDLSSLVGQSVRFRFRLGTDYSGDDYGWFIDDVRIYTCDVGGSLKLSAPTYSVSEAGANATVTVTRTGGQAGDVTLDYDTSDGGATAGSDYTATSGTLTFASKVMSQSITVPVSNDTAAEGNEDFTVALSNVSGASATLGSPPSAVVTITDNDVAGSVQFSLAAYSIAEASPFATITVTRSGGSASGVTVHYATSNGTALAVSDYQATNGDLTFDAGVMSRSFQVPIVNDGIDEANETVNLTLSGPGGGATLGSKSTAVLTILDNDVAGSVQYSAAAYSASEGAGSALITVSRVGGAASGVTVNYATSDGTATAGSDYTGVSGTLTFDAGVLSKTFAVPITQDTIGENNETVNLSLSSPGGGATLGLRSTAVLTILEDETVLQFSAPQYSVSEATPKALITVKRSGIVTGSSSVQYWVADGTALAGSDYTAVPTGTLSFGPREVTKTFTVPILNDTAAEPDEFFVVGLSSPIAAALGPQATATVLITDNDAAVSFSSATYAGKEGGAPVLVTVKRTGNTTTPAVVHYATSDGTATSASLDYTATSGDLTFNPGVVAQTFKVTILDDAVPEPTETVNLTLSLVSGPARIGLGAAVLSITDSEPLVAFSAASFTANEAVPSATVTVKRTGPTTSQASVHYATSNGTATAGSDYTAAGGDLTFFPGVVSQTFLVPILQDSTPEPPETVNLTLSGATGASLGLSTATLTITDDDPSISFSAAAYSVKESVKSALVTVKRTGPLTAPATVNYATSNGTATAGSDYASASGTLSFAVGAATRTFTVSLLPDVQREGNETVNLTLSSPTGGALGLANAVLTIGDDDVASVVQLAAAGYSGSETAGYATITVKRTGGTTAIVSVNYGTANGTALAGSDYTATSGTLTFAPGETVKMFQIPITADLTPEATETLSVALSSPAGGATLGSLSTATVFVTD